MIGVRLGEYNIVSEPDCVKDVDYIATCADPIMRVGIEEIIVHPEYDPSSNNQFHDIALLRLNKDIEFTDFIQPICLSTKSELPPSFIAAGWGRTENMAKSNIKMKVNLPLVNKDHCQNSYSSRAISAGRTISETQLCAGGEDNKDTCTGDSGGPLMAIADDESGIPRWTSFGVVSFGPSMCGTAGWPGVYTKVSEYIPWIMSNLKP